MSTTTLRDDEEEESELDKKLWNVVEKTRTDGMLEATVEKVNLKKSNGSRVLVVYELPNGDTKRQSYDLPETADPNSELARLTRENGYSLEHATSLEGDTITVENSEGVWKPKLAPVEKNRTEELKDKVSEFDFYDEHVENVVNDGIFRTMFFGISIALVSLFMPIFYIPVIYLMIRADYEESSEPTPIMVFVFGTLLCGVAFAVAMLAFGFIDGLTLQMFYDSTRLPNGDLNVELQDQYQEMLP